MKRFRLSTLMLLIVIAALGVALVVQQRRAARHVAELQAQLAEMDGINDINFVSLHALEFRVNGPEDQVRAGERKPVADTATGEGVSK
jgi:hypothetical protein